ncbi:MAG TPA: glycosyltransferase family 39 protein [Acetobacteraceae bacterium]|nr:glycosyltransferase family 39 protein [Acetobacteraceae bacterium]
MSGPALPLAARPALRLQTQAFVLAAILLLAAILRLHHLGTTSLWTDELFTQFYAKTGLRFLWTEGLRLEPTPPLYYTLIALWERIAGDSAFALRLPSLVASLITLALTAALGRELFARKLSTTVGTLLLALAPTSLYYAQEARSYALQGAAIALALLGFARFLRTRTLGDLAIYGAGAALAVYLHPTSVLAVAACNGAALISTFGSSRLLDRPALLRWIAANALVTLVCLPLLPIFISPLASAGSTWVAPLSRWSLENTFGQTLAGTTFTADAMLIAEIGGAALAGLLLVPPWRPGRRASAVLLIVPALFLLLMIGFSLKKPLILTRTLAWLLVPLSLVLGDVLIRRTKLLAAAMLAAASVGAAMHLANVDALKEDWHGFLAGLPGLAPPALVVLAPHTSPAALAVYAPGAGPPVRLSDNGPPVVETTVIPAMLGTRTIDLAEMQAAIAAGRPVWLIYRRPEWEWVRPLLAGLPPPRLEMQAGEGPNPPMRAVRW